MAAASTSPVSRADLLRSIGWYLVVVPVGILLGFVAIDRLVGIPFGNLVFFTTIFAAVIWFAYAGWGGRMGAASTTDILFARSDQAFVAEVSEGGGFRFPRANRVLFVVTGVVAIGWAIVLVEYVLYW